MTRTALLMVAALAAGCLGTGSKQRGSSVDDEYEDFKCNGRRAEYLLVGGFVAVEMGIQLQCSDDGQSLTKWTSDENGEREVATYPLGRADFDEVWRAFEDAGWRNLRDCLNAKAKDDDQIYTFDVADDDSKVSFVCQGKDLPFPFDRVVNALDIAAGAVE